MSESKQQLIAEKERVWDQDGELVATVWARRPDETRLPGEAWIDMRTRIGPALDAAVQETISLARQFAAAPELVEALRKAHEAIEVYVINMDDGDQNSLVGQLMTSAIEVTQAALEKAGA
ncbi:hypothetical protein [Burkholderia glumae]|uniref:hypothetical protein n=1 Tax=Burkholderia glumae TaxID=337 RepID=UPI0005B992F8|nr:hypothetical protein [Burkholderia glumae]